MGISEQAGRFSQGNWLGQAAAKMLCGCAGCVMMLGAATARAGTVVTDNVISTVAQAQTNVPVTFGQIFKAGDIPRARRLPPPSMASR